MFVEFFAFFFLKLYRTALDEIKFYQNELTNLAMYSVALEGALLKAEGTSLSSTIERLLLTDRNAVMPISRSQPLGSQLLSSLPTIKVYTL